jgi:FAD/FMN-containing dehydrogenase
MVTPDAQWLEVTRLDHNLGKIHDAPQATFELRVARADGKTSRAGDADDSRRDVSARRARQGRHRQVPAGLPGVQKEGCDGLVTSARFILHRMPPAIRTVCLEFFGQVRDRRRRSSRSRTTSTRCPQARALILAGLEHLDERYVKAVGYATKAKRHGRPKMVLLGDIVGETTTRSRSARPKSMRIANARGAEGFVAVSADARKKFWLDRARTAAIAKHTNAFKINEDVVIPLDRARRLHRRHRAHQHRAVDPQQAALCDALARSSRARRCARWAPDSDTRPAQEHRRRKVSEARALVAQSAHAGRTCSTASTTTFPALQDHSIVVSWKRELQGAAGGDLRGLAFAPV